jgi:hypothetical protein
VLGDAGHDIHSLHAACDRCGCQLVAPRKRPETNLGHREHEPGRLRSVQMLEWPVLLGTAASPFARPLYAMRTQIERTYGNLCGLGGGEAGDQCVTKVQKCSTCALDRKSWYRRRGTREDRPPIAPCTRDHPAACSALGAPDTLNYWIAPMAWSSGIIAAPHLPPSPRQSADGPQGQQAH